VPQQPATRKGHEGARVLFVGQKLILARSRNVAESSAARLVIAEAKVTVLSKAQSPACAASQMSGISALFYESRPPPVASGRDLPHLIRIERRCPAEEFKTVGAALNRGPTGQLFDIGARTSLAFASLVDQSGRIGVAIVGLKKTYLSGEEIVDTSPTGLDE